LESLLGERLVGDEGVLILTREDGEGARLERLGAPAETVSWEVASDRMSLGQPAGDVPHAVLEGRGGAIRARSAIEALHRVVADSVVNADVQGIEQHGAGVTIFASDGIYEAEEVFVTAGAGTAPLAMAEKIEIPEQRAWSLRLTFESRSSSSLPCLLDHSGCFGEVAYGSPTPDGRGYAIGLSGSDGAIAAPNTEAPDPKRLTEIRSRTEAYAHQLMPDALGPLTGARQCLATPLRSGDDDFHVWRSGRVTYFAGHNLFKFAPLIGALLADSIEGRDLPEELRINPL
jgi:sarcosine oxidase